LSSLRIIGIGNPLLGDDGIGIAAVAQLQRMALPEGVEVIDGGTGGLTLLSLLEGAQRVILIDAVDMGRRPGTLAQFTLAQLLPAAGETSPSLHAMGVDFALRLGRELCLLPPLILFGVQPAVVAPGYGLSSAVAEALSPLLLAVIAAAAPACKKPQSD
jgi:hydrogenase maturation protease